jgi:N-methylhydantoinase A
VKRIAVDVGGTFTDVFLAADDEVVVHKLPSSPADPASATITGMANACALMSVGFEEIDMFLHSSTVATNALLERRGARVGLITTKGFRDILHIARHKRPLNFSLYQELPWQKAPLVHRRRRLTVTERVEPPGIVTKALDEAGLRQAIDELRRQEVDSVAVCFLHSYLNPVHEQKVASVLATELPDVFVSLRHVICPEYREYEAFNTVAMNAYVGPLAGRYFGLVERRLRERGAMSSVLFMTSSGGLESASSVAEKPVTMLLSGPVAGVIGGIGAGAAVGEENVVTLDVGGTSADIGVAPEGRPRFKHWLDNEIGGFGLRLPMVDVSTIGAGGGSIAWVDEGRMLHVGPQSAGAEPGPACYGRGGSAATVTDALLVLGRISEDGLLGGRMPISRKLAERAIQESVAEPLALELVAAALGVVKVATAHMVDAIELNSVRRGFDPRDFALVAFGGAGPLFAVEIARELGFRRTIVPRFPGIMSAIGLLMADIVHEESASVVRPLEAVSDAGLQEHFDRLESRVAAQLADEGMTGDLARLVRHLEARYRGQGYEIRVDIPAGAVDSEWRRAVADRFHDAHERQYSHAFRESPIEIVNVGVRGIGSLPRIQPPHLEHGAAAPQPRDRRQVWLTDDAEPELAGIYARDDLRVGDRISGPAVIEQPDSTLPIAPRVEALVQTDGSLVIEVQS